MQEALVPHAFCDANLNISWNHKDMKTLRKNSKLVLEAIEHVSPASVLYMCPHWAL